MTPTGYQATRHTDTKGFMLCLLIASHLSAHIVAAFTLFTCGRGRIYCRYKELLYKLCHLCTDGTTTPDLRYDILLSFFLDVYISSCCCFSFPASVPTRGLWLLQRVMPPVSPSFISPALPFMFVPPVYDECRCLCPIQLV